MRITIGTSFTHLRDTHTLAPEVPTGKGFVGRIAASGIRRLPLSRLRSIQPGLFASRCEVRRNHRGHAADLAQSDILSAVDGQPSPGHLAIAGGGLGCDLSVSGAGSLGLSGFRLNICSDRKMGAVYRTIVPIEDSAVPMLNVISHGRIVSVAPSGAPKILTAIS